MWCLLVLLAGTAAASNTLKVDASVKRILIGDGAQCDADSGHPQICLGPNTPVAMCALQLTRFANGTLVAKSRATGEIVWAVSPACALSVGPSMAFGPAGSITVTPRAMQAVTDGVWTVDSEIAFASGYQQRVRLSGTTYTGARYKQAGQSISYVLLDNGVLVFDTNITRDVVLGGLEARVAVISMYTIFAPEPYNAPVISVVDVLQDGSSELLLREYASPSKCGSTLSRQETRTQLALGECLAVNDRFRLFLNISDEGLYESLMFPACPPTGNRTLVANLFTADCDSTPDSVRGVQLGACLSDETQMLECQVGM
jgi:hypothetical protein